VLGAGKVVSASYCEGTPDEALLHAQKKVREGETK
jgi:hypothetical protein